MRASDTYYYANQTSPPKKLECSITLAHVSKVALVAAAALQIIFIDKGPTEKPMMEERLPMWVGPPPRPAWRGPNLQPTNYPHHRTQESPQALFVSLAWQPGCSCSTMSAPAYHFKLEYTQLMAHFSQLQNRALLLSAAGST
jgi:hypothetical protein